MNIVWKWGSGGRWVGDGDDKPTGTTGGTVGNRMETDHDLKLFPSLLKGFQKPSHFLRFALKRKKEETCLLTSPLVRLDLRHACKPASPPSCSAAGLVAHGMLHRVSQAKHFTLPPI